MDRERVTRLELADLLVTSGDRASDTLVTHAHVQHGVPARPDVDDGLPKCHKLIVGEGERQSSSVGEHGVGLASSLVRGELRLAGATRLSYVVAESRQLGPMLPPNRQLGSYVSP